MEPLKKVSSHQTFIIRAWLEAEGEDYFWCFRVQNVRNDEWYSIARVALLIEFIQDHLEEIYNTYQQNSNDKDH